MLVRAVVKALRASATDEMPGGGDDEVVTKLVRLLALLRRL
jgi:hypothetical protein